MEDESKNWVAFATCDYNSSMLSAEWIDEDPNATTLLPFANFTSALYGQDFTEAKNGTDSAVISGVSGPISAFNREAILMFNPVTETYNATSDVLLKGGSSFGVTRHGLSVQALSQESPSPIYANSTVTFKAPSSGESSPTNLSYAWYQGSSSFVEANYISSTSSNDSISYKVASPGNLTLVAVVNDTGFTPNSQAYNYSVFTVLPSTTTSTTSTTTTTIPYAPPSPAISPSSASVDQGQGLSFRAADGSLNGINRVLWQLWNGTAGTLVQGITTPANATAVNFTQITPYYNTTYSVSVAYLNSTNATITNRTYSSPASVTVYPRLNVAISPQFPTIGPGLAAALNVVVVGGTGNYSYQWYSTNSIFGNYSLIPNATGPSYGTGPLSSRYTFVVDVTDLHTYPGNNIVSAAATAYVEANAIVTVPITVHNSQDAPTPAGFQQLIDVNMSKYAAYSSGLNSFFWYNGSVLPSWEEGADNPLAPGIITYWIKLSHPVPPNGTITIDLKFEPLGTVVDTGAIGAAPGIGSHYGQYDNGGYIFNYYQNFAGTSAPGWNLTQSTNLTSAYVDNGLTLQSGVNGLSQCGGLACPSATASTVAHTFGLNANYILDIPPSITSAPTDATAGYGGVAGAGRCYYFIYGSNGDFLGSCTQTLAYCSTCGNIYNNPIFLDGPGASIYWGNTSAVSFSSGYGYGGPHLDDTSGATPQPIYLTSESTNQGSSGEISFDWIRQRLRPPNGVMPSFALGTTFIGNFAMAVSTPQNFAIALGQNLTLSGLNITGGMAPYSYRWFATFMPDAPNYTEAGGDEFCANPASISCVVVANHTVTPGLYSFILQATDVNNFTSNSFPINVVVGIPLSATISQSNTVLDYGQRDILSTTIYNGVGPFNVSLEYGNGTVISTVANTPQRSVTFSFTPGIGSVPYIIRATDLGTLVPFQFNTPAVVPTVNPAAAPSTPLPASLPSLQGRQERYSFNVVGGTGPFNVSVVAGNGTVLERLSGAPAGAYSFNVVPQLGNYSYYVSATDGGTTVPFTSNSPPDFIRVLPLPSPGLVFAASHSASSPLLLVLNATSGAQVAEVGIGANAVGAALALSQDGTAYIATANGKGMIYVVNTMSYAVENVIDPRHHHAANDSDGALLGPEGPYLYVSTHGGNVITVNTSNLSVANVLNLGSKMDIMGMAMAPGGGTIYLAVKKGQLETLDTSSYTVTSNVMLPSKALSIALSPSGGSIYVGATSPNALLTLNASTMAIANTLPLNDCKPHMIAVSPTGEYAYVACHASGKPLKVKAVDLASDTVVNTMKGLGDSPGSVALSPDGSLLYISNKANGTISLVNATSYSKVGTMSANVDGIATVQVTAPVPRAYGALEAAAMPIGNLGGQPTQQAFQVGLSIDSAAYTGIWRNWSNVEFTSAPLGAGTALPAWVESNATNSSTNTTVWVRLPASIPAGGSYTAYLDIVGNDVMSASGPTGEAPQLSPRYGEYDNGAGVFNFYDNFAGNSLSNAWNDNFTGPFPGFNSTFEYCILFNATAGCLPPFFILNASGEYKSQSPSGPFAPVNRSTLYSVDNGLALNVTPLPNFVFTLRSPQTGPLAADTYGYATKDGGFGSSFSDLQTDSPSFNFNIGGGALQLATMFSPFNGTGTATESMLLEDFNSTYGDTLYSAAPQLVVPPLPTSSPQVMGVAVNSTSAQGYNNYFRTTIEATRPRIGGPLTDYPGITLLGSPGNFSTVHVTWFRTRAYYLPGGLSGIIVDPPSNETQLQASVVSTNSVTVQHFWHVI